MRTRICCGRRCWRSRTSIARRQISEVSAALVLGHEECLAALRPSDWTPRLCDDYTTGLMSIAKRTNKPLKRATPRRLSATLRAARVTKALSLSDLEWRALQAGRRRKRRVAETQVAYRSRSDSSRQIT